MRVTWKEKSAEFTWFVFCVGLTSAGVAVALSCFFLGVRLTRYLLGL